ncbi:MAG: O-antigen ligase family protein [Candidatus Moranbacteria bacterium]|nr:O-antigen ligase family protein [Candidatus Moranbacteria bacterium]
MKNSLENIEKILIFLVFLSFPFMDARTSVFGVPFYLPEALVLSALAIHGVRFLKKNVLPRRIPTAVAPASALMLLGAVSSMVVNGTDRDALGAIKSWFLFPMLFSWLVFKSGFSERDARRAVWGWFFGVAVIAFSTLIIPSLSTETYDERLRSIFPSPNHFGFFLEYGAILGLGLVIFLKDRKDILFLLVLSEAAIVSALLLTRSDGASLSFAVGSAVVLVSALVPSGISKKILGIGSFLVIFSLVGAFITVDRDSLGSGEVRSPLASRVMIWNASSYMIVEHPIFGIGPRNFQEEYLALQPEFPRYLEWAVPHPHNIMLSFWVFTGLTGFLGLLILLGHLLRNILSAVLSGSPGATRIFPSVLLGLLVVFLVHGLVDTPYFRNDLAYAFWAIVAFILIATDKKSAEAPKRLYEP